MNIGLPSFFKQASDQGFLLTVGAIYIFWKEGAPIELLYVIGGYGAISAVFEKVKAFAKPKEPESKS